MKALKVDELKAVLTFKGVALDNLLKKADLHLSRCSRARSAATMLAVL